MSRVGVFGQISEINDHLYLSGAGVLRPEKIKQKKIACVVNATTEEPNAYLPGVDYMKIRIEDNPYARLDHYFDMVADKIRADRGGKTLVHCMAGVSRSASLCIVYLIKYERMSLRQAYHYVKSARPIIRPNVGFWKQMVDYERKLRGHTTVQMIRVDHCDLLIPDVYSNDLLKKHALLRAVEEQQREQPRAKSAASNIPIDFTKRRGLSAGYGNTDRVSSGAKTMDSLRNRNGSTAIPSPLSAYPWRHVSMLSPAPNRRPRQENLFGNLYNTREAFFSAF
ncbi:Protein C04F12.8 [Aphelenchoides avenae]|nr:Protein C04F12.8 [Aphelenchus avenae]